MHHRENTPLSILDFIYCVLFLNGGCYWVMVIGLYYVSKLYSPS